MQDATPRAPLRHEIAIGAGIVALCALAIALVDPRGDFPLNDDWAYAFSTERFLETGVIERLRWTWAPIVAHVWVGAAASALAGFSFETLRATTLLLGCAALLATYALARSAGIGPARSALCAAVLGVCPVFFNLWFTFMTDVPFAFWTTGSAAALCASLRARGRRAFALGACGVALCAAATSVRQPGAAVAVAFAAALAATRIRSARGFALLAVSGAGVAGIALLASGAMFGGADGGGTMLRYLARRVLANPNLPYFLFCNALVVLCYVGAFLSPIAPLVAPPAHARPLALASAATGAAVSLALAALSFDAPPGLNLVWNTGLGARTLDGQELLPHAASAVWWCATALGAACGAWCLGALALAAAARGRELRDRPELAFLAIFPLVYLATLGLRIPFFDRYLGAAIPPLCVLALALAGRTRSGLRARALAATALAVLGAYSLAGTRDYMEHHRARAVLLDALEADGISPRRIDGGFEHAGRFNFDRDNSLFIANERRWVVDDEYLVSHASEREGYTRLRTVEHARWLPPGRASVSLLRRDPDFAPERRARRSPRTSDRR